MTSCPYGKASLCFPLAISGTAALNVLASADGLLSTFGEVVGLTTQKTCEAGAATLRLSLKAPLDNHELEHGSHLIALRSHGHTGWLPALAGTRQPQRGERLFMEAVVFGRPDKRLESIMFLSEETLAALYPSEVEVRVISYLLPAQRDCPPQWLRDRLLRLADMVETTYWVDQPLGQALGQALQSAGLRFFDGGQAGSHAIPADAKSRVSADELGYWDEEKRLGNRCAASMDGQGRLDCPDHSYGLDGQ